ncbi:MoaF C-terminal domain-containing protein [Amycolatopsis regifaucium]|uniref:Molybdenum cofactor biosynthesis protein MoaF n=1 Tax=Amycolatopsis regifaucium TaxID=546365 RepID=A0A154MY09_9PSEU|nr:MoaF C-terminal domain-containing protein [Amycolatopsis regifaucium]KZB88637.1 molybdenum cofactor biosynthesis protein MoaF [Amycolatopsis regifaucium]OKA07193.1 molybdenum cofactor biosynthesis protein MoaF [Amycolatopsis regifaucium]SFI54477.1 Molybdenum cofactor biosynthesis protein F [Amycolatopsis regifaucium]
MSEAPEEQWRTYDEFAAGIATYRLPNADLSGRELTVTLEDGTTLALRFEDAETATCNGIEDPYDAVAVREDVFFVNFPLTSVEGEALTVVFSTTTHRALAVRSVIGAEDVEGVPRVSQTFRSGTTDAGTPAGEVPGPSRDLIGKRNVYRYSPEHLYEHVYVSSQRYAWQCLEGVQRGHGDMDLSTVWKFQDGLYLFCFREFRIAVASVWLHDLGYALKTTGVFLGLTGDGRSEHSRAGGHIYPLGAVAYPDAQPV